MVNYIFQKPLHHPEMWISCVNLRVIPRVFSAQKMCTFLPSFKNMCKILVSHLFFPPFPQFYPQPIHPYSLTIFSTIPQPLQLPLLIIK